jgi:TetR/AcrR family tetracycline transcriptional repressor
VDVQQRRREPLTREMIVESAIRLIDADGLDGLTMRRCAAQLGVQNPALYWHFRDKQELLDAVADEIVRAPGMGPPRAGETWQEWLLRRGRGYRRALLAHRDGARIVATARSLSADTVRRFDDELVAMVQLGFTPVLALRTVAAISRYVTGFVLQEQRDRRTEGLDQPLPALTELLQSGAVDTLHRAIRDGGDPDGEDTFEHGLQAMIEGVARHARVS